MPAGCGLPGVVKAGKLKTAANLDPAWIDHPVERVLVERLGRPVLALNDADAAGIAEIVYGAARGRQGTVLLITIGTGLGNALFIDGRLLPNTELGHITVRGEDAEELVSGEARERRGLGWKRWAREFNEFLAVLEAHVWPDLIILGGGVSKEMDKFAPYLETRAEVRAAAYRNIAGIVGSAYAGARAAAGAGGPDDPAGSAIAERYDVDEPRRRERSADGGPRGDGNSAEADLAPGGDREPAEVLEAASDALHGDGRSGEDRS